MAYAEALIEKRIALLGTSMSLGQAETDLRSVLTLCLAPRLDANMIETALLGKEMLSLALVSGSALRGNLESLKRKEPTTDAPLVSALLDYTVSTGSAMKLEFQKALEAMTPMVLKPEVQAATYTIIGFLAEPSDFPTELKSMFFQYGVYDTKNNRPEYTTFGQWLYTGSSTKNVALGANPHDSLNMFKLWMHNLGIWDFSMDAYGATLRLQRGLHSYLLTDRSSTSGGHAASALGTFVRTCFSPSGRNQDRDVQEMDAFIGILANQRWTSQEIGVFDTAYGNAFWEWLTTPHKPNAGIYALPEHAHMLYFLLGLGTVEIPAFKACVIPIHHPGHFTTLVLYKDASGKLNAAFLDSHNKKKAGGKERVEQLNKAWVALCQRFNHPFEKTISYFSPTKQPKASNECPVVTLYFLDRLCSSADSKAMVNTINELMNTPGGLDRYSTLAFNWLDTTALPFLQARLDFFDKLDAASSDFGKSLNPESMRMNAFQAFGGSELTDKFVRKFAQPIPIGWEDAFQLYVLWRTAQVQYPDSDPFVSPVFWAYPINEANLLLDSRTFRKQTNRMVITSGRVLAELNNRSPALTTWVGDTRQTAAQLSVCFVADLVPDRSSHRQNHETKLALECRQLFNHWFARLEKSPDVLANAEITRLTNMFNGIFSVLWKEEKNKIDTQGDGPYTLKAAMVSLIGFKLKMTQAQAAPTPSTSSSSKSVLTASKPTSVPSPVPTSSSTSVPSAPPASSSISVPGSSPTPVAPSVPTSPPPASGTPLTPGTAATSSSTLVPTPVPASSSIVPPSPVSVLHQPLEDLKTQVGPRASKLLDPVFGDDPDLFIKYLQTNVTKAEFQSSWALIQTKAKTIAGVTKLNDKLFQMLEVVAGAFASFDSYADAAIYNKQNANKAQASIRGGPYLLRTVLVGASPELVPWWEAEPTDPLRADAFKDHGIANVQDIHGIINQSVQIFDKLAKQLRDLEDQFETTFKAAGTEPLPCSDNTDLLRDTTKLISDAIDDSLKTQRRLLDLGSVFRDRVRVDGLVDLMHALDAIYDVNTAGDLERNLSPVAAYTIDPFNIGAPGDRLNPTNYFDALVATDRLKTAFLAPDARNRKGWGKFVINVAPLQWNTQSQWSSVIFSSTRWNQRAVACTLAFLARDYRHAPTALADFWTALGRVAYAAAVGDVYPDRTQRNVLAQVYTDYRNDNGAYVGLPPDAVQTLLSGAWLPTNPSAYVSYPVPPAHQHPYSWLQPSETVDESDWLRLKRKRLDERRAPLPVPPNESEADRERRLRRETERMNAAMFDEYVSLTLYTDEAREARERQETEKRERIRFAKMIADAAQRQRWELMTPAEQARYKDSAW